MKLQMNCPSTTTPRDVSTPKNQRTTSGLTIAGQGDSGTAMSTKKALSTIEANHLREAAKAASRGLGANEWRLAELLYKTSWSRAARATQRGEVVPVWATWGWDSWRQYVETELHLTYGQANRMRNTFFRFGVELKGKWNLSSLLPMGKMSALSTVVRPGNVEEMLKKAASVSTSEIRERAAASGRGSGDMWKGQTLYTFAARTTRAEQRVIDAALDAAREANPNLRRKGALLAVILKGFVAEAQEQTQTKKVRTDRQVTKLPSRRAA